MKNLSDGKTKQTVAKVLVALPLCLYPLSHLPEVPGLQISPFQIIAVIIGLFGAYISTLWLLVNIQNLRLKAASKQPLSWMVLLLVWLSVSYIWGVQSRRALYFIALSWLGLMFAIGLYTLIKMSKLKFRSMARVITVVGIGLSLFGVYQFVGESYGLSRSYTEICATCIQEGIGFARASGFSQEPQYFSTVLLLPLGLLLWLLMENKFILRRSLQWGGFVAIMLALLLGASRGGLVGLGVVLASFFIYGFLHRNYVFGARLVGGFICALILALGLIGWSGKLSGHQGSTYTIQRYIAHISGGVIKIGDESERIDSIEESIDKQKATSQQPESYDYITQATNYGPSGAIIYSTQSRIETYREAFNLWHRDPKTLLIGVGWSSFGTIAEKQKPGVFKPEVLVNNQPLQFAVELGLVGLILSVLATVSLVLFVLRFRISTNARFVILVLLAAYAAQLLFYSAFHLLQFWLSLALIFYVLELKPSKSANGIL